MRVERYNLVAKVTSCTDDERHWLADYLSLPNPGARFSGGPPRITLFDHLALTFPAGWTPWIAKIAKEEGKPFEVTDLRVSPCQPVPADLGWLRPEQLAAVETCIRRTRGIVSIPTGGGKTEVAIGLALRIPCRWVFLVGDLTLLKQTAERFEKRTGEKAGIVGDGVWDVQRFTVAMFDTLYARLKRRDPDARTLLGDAQGVLIDECHELPADSNTRVAMSTPAAYWRFGLSGTPLDRTDKKGAAAIGVLGPVIVKIDAKALIAQGLLAMPIIRMVKVDQHSLIPTWRGVKGKAIVTAKPRNEALVEIAKRCEKPALLFVEAVKHGVILKREIEKAGIATDFVFGESSTAQREDRVRWLMAGKLDVLICSVIFQQGIDVPDLRSIVVASGGKSVIATLQRIGRGMRLAPGKTTFEVWDIFDEGVLWLEEHSKKRLRAYEGQGYTVSVEPLHAPTQARIPGS